MQFSLDLSHHPWTRRAANASPEAMHRAALETLRTIRVADEAGLESVWLSEDPDGWDAFSVLSAAATQTERIRLGSGVTNPYMRHPNLTAMSIATLDRLSGGRAFLGLGRGQPEWYRTTLGIPTGKPLTALQETIDLLHQWWQEPHRATVDGHFQISDWARAISPIQGSVPIYLAALGPKALEVAAQYADGVLIADFASPEFLEELIPWMTQKIREYGRDPSTFRYYVRTAITVTDDPDPALKARKGFMALLCPLPGMSQQIRVPGFDVDAIMDNVRKVMQTEEVLARGGNFIDIRQTADFAAARDLIPDELIQEISYIGGEQEIREKLSRLKRAGVTDVFVAPPGDRSTEEYAAMVASIRP